MFGECHAHVIMDGINYQLAVKRHEHGPDEQLVRKCLETYQKAGVSFVRDGGDARGVSALAKKLAPEYGIDYRTPVFAIHKEGHYGGIVGRGFSSLKEFHQLVLEAKKKGADFIKIMTTGLLDFENHGKITGAPLEGAEVREMVHIAHEEGFAVMSHTNGVCGVRAAVEAGVDSLEHGNYMDDETLSMLADSHTVWVPTLVTVRNLLGCGRYQDEVLRPIIRSGEENLKKAYDKGVKAALGSDAGAYRVMHGAGIQEEYKAFLDILGDSPEVKQWIRQGQEEIEKRFRRN